MINWIELTRPEQLEHIRHQSFLKPQVIFKHSTRCSTSILAKNRLEREKAPSDVDFYYLDLLTYRQISNLIAESFNVWHESPQVLVIRDGECIYDESHLGIQMEEISSMVSRTQADK